VACFMVRFNCSYLADILVTQSLITRPFVVLCTDARSVLLHAGRGSYSEIIIDRTTVI